MPIPKATRVKIVVTYDDGTEDTVTVYKCRHSILSHKYPDGFTYRAKGGLGWLKDLFNGAPSTVCNRANY